MDVPHKIVQEFLTRSLVFICRLNVALAHIQDICYAAISNTTFSSIFSAIKAVWYMMKGMGSQVCIGANSSSTSY